MKSCMITVEDGSQMSLRGKLHAMLGVCGRTTAVIYVVHRKHLPSMSLSSFGCPYRHIPHPHLLFTRPRAVAVSIVYHVLCLRPTFPDVSRAAALWCSATLKPTTESVPHASLLSQVPINAAVFDGSSRECTNAATSSAIVACRGSVLCCVVLCCVVLCCVVLCWRKYRMGCGGVTMWFSWSYFFRRNGASSSHIKSKSKGPLFESGAEVVHFVYNFPLRTYICEDHRHRDS
ncbi:hypothetical protein DE146DRAFT_380159 [Phaeosphaeria sp. MPI-PUGE-AT-0046c]|nr:hypothetical protein DE146DRAFT_380159 [Phaeosphaeria sp. MPI-PUGE-AT-0046c]